MTELALFGGTPEIKGQLEKYNSVGAEEKAAVNEVMESGCLSGFFGSWEEGFFGGPKVQEFEELWKSQFKTKHAVTVNSNTSGLIIAMGAIGITPGDEVIVPPTSMSATSSAPLFYGGVPVFADIEEETFCIDPEQVEKKITPRTKAIIAVNLFGHPAQLKKLKEIAKKHKIYLIEDNAQAPLATEDGSYCGTVGDIGVFSLNYHKHIHCGEGGVCLTNDDELALKLQMIRNHAEAVVESAGVKDLTNMVGFNMRLPELSAAIGTVQLKNVEKHLRKRQKLANRLTAGLKGIDGFKTPHVRENCEHVYYCWIAKYDQELIGVDRNTFAKALQAEGFPCTEGYVRPLYLLPMFQNKKGIGRGEFPFNLTNVVYEKGLCPVAENMHENKIVEFEVCAFDVSEQEELSLINAFHKVYDNREQLKQYELKKAS